MLPLVTPLSEYGKRTLYAIKEYEPLLDSSNMASEDWKRIAEDLHGSMDAWDAFIVLHGTDTMSFTATALSFMLQNLSKTVVVTGSQIPFSRPRNDAIGNVLGSLHIVGHFDIPEVCIFFDNNLMRGNRSTKVTHPPPWTPRAPQQFSRTDLHPAWPLF
jgi:60kDa lysophospholipase